MAKPAGTIKYIFPRVLRVPTGSELRAPTGRDWILATLTVPPALGWRPHGTEGRVAVPGELIAEWPPAGPGANPHGPILRAPVDALMDFHQRGSALADSRFAKEAGRLAARLSELVYEGAVSAAGSKEKAEAVSTAEVLRALTIAVTDFREAVSPFPRQGPLALMTHNQPVLLRRRKEVTDPHEFGEIIDEPVDVIVTLVESVTVE